MLKAVSSSKVTSAPYPETIKPSRYGNLGAIVKRVAIVGALALAISGAAVATAMTLGMDWVVFASAGGFGGMILGLFLSRQRPKANQGPQTYCPSSQPINPQPIKTITDITHALKKEFVQANEQKVQQLVGILELQENIESKGTHLNDQQLDQVLELVDETKTNVTAQYQIDQLRTRLAKKFSQAKADEVFQHAEIFPQGLMHDKHLISNKMIDHMFDLAVNFVKNQEAIARLKSKIEPEVLDKVFIKLDLKEVLKGQRQLGSETEQAILDCAKAVQAEDEFDQLIEAVKESAKKDLYLDDQFIEKHYHVAEKLQHLQNEEIRKARRAQLQAIINQAYCVREMKNKGKLTSGDKDEVSLLGYFGHKVNNESAYFDKDSLYVMVKEIIHNQLHIEKCTAPLQHVREMIRMIAVRTRLKTAGLSTELQMDKFMAAHTCLKQVKESLQELQDECKLDLPADFPLNGKSLNLQRLNEEFDDEKEHAVTNMILGLIFKDSAIVNGFKSEELSLNEFKTDFNHKKLLDENIDPVALQQKWSNVQNKSYFQKQIAFFKAWGSYLKAEMVQGLNDQNEVLGNGVCWGISQRVRLKVQEKPDLSVEEFAKVFQIGSQDRFLQGNHAMDVSFSKGNGTLPKNILKESGYTKEELIVKIEGDKIKGFTDDLKRILKVRLEKETVWMHNSNGWATFFVRMPEGGHATLMRMDWTTGRIWFADSNIGYFVFEEKDVSFDDTQKLFFSFLNDLISLNYPETYKIELHKLIE